ncbi:hypothetical protein ACS6BV_001659 [Vibrio alginolyticus]
MTGLKTIGVVVSWCRGVDKAEGSKSAETLQIKRYINSVELSAKNLLENTRAHWIIENQSHWRPECMLQ